LSTAATIGTADRAAGRLRSMLAAAQSLTLHTTEHRADLAGRHAVTDDGELSIELPADTCLAQQLVREGELVVMIELTDLAPTRVRDRVRDRATLTGWLTPASAEDGEVLATLDLATAELITRRGAVQVDPDDFAAARPDPLAELEAELLCHLDDHHPRTVELLSRLLPAHRLLGVRVVRPLALDRWGIVLRLEHASRDSDVRLDFLMPLSQPAQLADQVEALLARAWHCRSAR
jgi:hypothetical protein